MTTPYVSGEWSRRCCSSHSTDAEAALPDLECLDLAAWVSEHSRTWSAHERAADLHSDAGHGEPLWIRAHRPLLAELLDNLLENASKYSTRARRSS